MWVSRIVKFSELLPYLKANKLVCQFRGCWQKSQASYIRDKGLYHSEQPQFLCLLALVLPLQLPQGDAVSAR